MAKQQITAVIVAKNESSVIDDALKSVAWCDKILHIDNGSTDDTKSIVKKYGGETIATNEEHFDKRKNIAIKKVVTPWMLYLDADERISPMLRHEIIDCIKSSSPESAFRMPRRNIYLGREMKFGGWGNEFVIRLFRTSSLKGWKGILHEEPLFEGKLGSLQNEIVHLSHRDLESMLEKTILFTDKEAALRFMANHPSVSWWRFFRVMLTEAHFRFFKLSAWRDGPEGLIDGIFQVFNSFIIYSRLWEMQRSANA